MCTPSGTRVCGHLDLLLIRVFCVPPTHPWASGAVGSMSAKSSCSRTSSSQGVPVADAAGAGAGARADPRFKGNAYLGRIPEMTLEIAADRFMKLRAEERQVAQACRSGAPRRKAASHTASPVAATMCFRLPSACAVPGIDRASARARQVSAGDALWGVRSQGTHGFCARAVDADVKYEGDACALPSRPRASFRRQPSCLS